MVEVSWWKCGGSNASVARSEPAQPSRESHNTAKVSIPNLHQPSPTICYFRLLVGNPWATPRARSELADA